MNEADNGSRSPLYVASGRGRFQVVIALIEAGADVHRTDNKGKTALPHALRCGFQDIVDTIQRQIYYLRRRSLLLMRLLTTNKDNEEGQGEHQEERAATPLARLLMSFTLEGRGIRKRTGKYPKKNERMNGRMNDS